MPLRVKTKMEQRLEIVTLALHDETNIAELSRRFQISRKTVYNWLKRYKEDQTSGLVDRSTRPRNSPNKTPDEIEALILELRDKHINESSSLWVVGALFPIRHPTIAACTDCRDQNHLTNFQSFRTYRHLVQTYSLLI